LYILQLIRVAKFHTHTKRGTVTFSCIPVVTYLNSTSEAKDSEMCGTKYSTAGMLSDIILFLKDILMSYCHL